MLTSTDELGLIGQAPGIAQVAPDLYN